MQAVQTVQREQESQERVVSFSLYIPPAAPQQYFNGIYVDYSLFNCMWVVHTSIQ